MKVTEAYLKFNKQLIIMISGMTGCNKKRYAKQISVDLGNLEIIDQSDFYKDDFTLSVVLKNGVTVETMSSYEAYDWSKFNEVVNDKKSNGVVVVGSALINSKLTFKPDFHIHISIPKSVCVKKRDAYLEKHKAIYPDEYKHIGETTRLKINQVIFPFYLQTHKDSSYDLFIKTEEYDTNDEIYDLMFNKVIAFIQSKLP